MIALRYPLLCAAIAVGALDPPVGMAAPFEPVILKGHTGWVGGVGFSPDGKTLATASADATVKLWDVRSGKELATLKGHTDVVSCVAFSPDGKTLVSGSYDRTAKVWDLQTKTVRNTLPGSRGAVLSVAYFPTNADKIAVAGIDGEIRTWDSGNASVGFTHHKSWVNALAFRPTGGVLASASSDSTVVIRGPMINDVVRLEPKAAEVRSLAFSADGKFLAAGTRYGLTKVWDATTDKAITSLKGKHGGDVWAVGFNHECTMLAMADGDWNKPSDVVLWDTATWQERVRLQQTNEVLCLAFSPREPVLVAGSWDNTVRVWTLTKLLKADR